MVDAGGPQSRGADDELRITLTIGIAPVRDASESTIPARAEAVRREIDRANFAWHSPVVESRTRIERGQGEAWLLLASTCGVLSETTNDAGVGAAVVAAAAAQAAEGAGDARVEPFIATDGVGVLIHGPARRGRVAARARPSTRGRRSTCVRRGSPRPGLPSPRRALSC